MFKTKEEFLLATYVASVQCGTIKSNWIPVESVFKRAKEMLLEHKKVMAEIESGILIDEKEGSK